MMYSHDIMNETLERKYFIRESRIILEIKATTTL
jgi:hypothetical protein